MTEPPHPPADGSDRAPTAADHFRWQAIFERASEPIFLLDRRRRILFANTAWQSLTGIPLVEARALVCKRQTTAEPGSREALLSERARARTRTRRWAGPTEARQRRRR